MKILRLTVDVAVADDVKAEDVIFDIEGQRTEKELNREVVGNTILYNKGLVGKEHNIDAAEPSLFRLRHRITPDNSITQ